MSIRQHSLSQKTSTTSMETPQDQAPAYTDPNSPSTYTTDAAARHLLLLREGDPNEKIDVPFVYSQDKKTLKDYLAFRNVGTVTRRIVPRSMTRRLYNERYAHDAEGSDVGSGTKAPDAGLVFVPGKGTEKELLEQVRRMANSRSHDPGDFAFQGGNGMAPVGGGWAAS